MAFATPVKPVLWNTHQRMITYKMTTSDTPKKYLTLTYLSDGNIDLEMNGLTTFDLWSLSNYIKMVADEKYIEVRAVTKISDAAKSPQIVTTGQMPRGPGRVAPLRND
jgi:hypothetical protein